MVAHRQTASAAAAGSGEAGRRIRRICAFSGKRGGFGAYVPLLRLLEADAAFDLLILLGDQHGSERFGRTADEVQAAFPDSAIAAIDMGAGRGDSALERLENLSVCLAETARILERHRPDLVLVHGDRGEHLMVALAALTLGIAVAHTQGGDRSGNVDDIQRHAISKLAHLHFPETESAAERLVRMGEEPWRIHMVGSTYVDRILAGLYAPPEDARRRLGLAPSEPFALVIVHPETWAQAGEGRRAAEAALEGIRRAGLRAVVTYPCSDPGYEEIVAVLEAAAGEEAFVVRPNIENDVYLGLMAGAEALVGNSSAALVEAPYFQLPAVNVGTRQDGRERDANVVDVPDWDAAAIAAALARVRAPEFRAALDGLPLRLGDGGASRRIVEVLRHLELDDRLLRKRSAV